MKLLSLTAAALLAAVPAQAQPITTAPGTWQITDICRVKMTEVDTKTGQETDVSNEVCRGITVAVKDNVNVNFEADHPALRHTIMTYVLVPGPYRGEHPVEIIVSAIGTRDQATLDVEVGYCRIVQAKTPGSMLVFCTGASETNAEGKYVWINSWAQFSSPLAPKIRSALR